MNPQTRELIDRLRSGQDKQIRGVQHTCDGYCAEGLMSEIYRLHHPESCVWIHHGSAYRFNIDGEECSMHFLSRRVWEWFDLPPGGPSLLTMNDVAMLTFPQIADELEGSFR